MIEELIDYFEQPEDTGALLEEMFRRSHVMAMVGSEPKEKTAAVGTESIKNTVEDTLTNFHLGWIHVCQRRDFSVNLPFIWGIFYWWCPASLFGQALGMQRWQIGLIRLFCGCSFVQQMVGSNDLIKMMNYFATCYGEKLMTGAVGNACSCIKREQTEWFKPRTKMIYWGCRHTCPSEMKFDSKRR